MKKTTRNESSPSYTAKDLVFLEGLEPVRQRPGMYIGGVHKTGLHHLLWEIVDNAVDEVINGFADTIAVTVHRDGQSVTISDNGRGIPIDIHPEKKRPALELLLTTLHSGGKFGKDNYLHSGGLHGVGLSVVNALSSNLVVEVARDGGLYRQEYSRGFPITPLKLIKRNIRQTGTTITFSPDPLIFTESISFDAQLIRERLDVRAFLHRKLRIHFTDEITGKKEEFYHEGGIEDYLKKQLLDKGKKAVHEGFFTHRTDKEIRLEVTCCWTESTEEQIRSFVNGIPTPSGGSHENGFKTTIAKALRHYISTNKLTPKGISFTTDDLREGIVALISVYVLEPQFQGQTKERLNNPEVAPLVEQALRTAFNQWLIENSSIAKAIVERNIMAAKARQASRAASQMVRRQSPTRRLNLPGKLSDCSSQDPTLSELFIVEGDSAGGSAKMGRDRKTQAILPLRGKVLNSETASLKKVLANKELNDIVQALGCGIGKSFDISKLRYHKIILLMDADADGHHISTLLLTFFYRHLPNLLYNGHVYIAQPPLYRIQYNKKIEWALDDDQKEQIIASFPKNAQVDIQRFKGLGEMMPETLKKTTLDPKRRTLLKVVIADELQTDQTITNLMGRDSNARFRFIMEHAHEVDELDTIG